MNLAKTSGAKISGQNIADDVGLVFSFTTCQSAFALLHQIMGDVALAVRMIGSHGEIGVRQASFKRITSCTGAINRTTIEFTYKWTTTITLT